MPLAGMVPMLNMQLGEVVFGVGGSLYGMLMMAILAVFIAGLMVGRTPEYIGKKIEGYEVKMAMLATLVLAASILASARGVRWRVGDEATSTAPTASPRSSTCSARRPGTTARRSAGIGGNNPFYNTAGLAMLIGRYLMIVPLLAIGEHRQPSGAFPRASGRFRPWARSGSGCWSA